MCTERACRILLLIVCLAFGALSGCGETAEPGDLVEETHYLELEGAKRVDVKIEMAVGKLSIDGGSDDLLDAQFTYNVKDWKPSIAYRVEGDVGRLTVRQRETRARSFGRGIKCDWDLRFGDKAPIDLVLEVGAGECRLDFEDLPVSDLDLKFGAGDVDVIIGGSKTLRDFDLEAGAGDIVLDLTGHWDTDLDARIKAGVGKITIYLPEDAGVRVKTSKGIGKVGMTGLVTKGDYHVNEAYGDSDVTLDIEVEAGVGAIELRVGEPPAERVTI
jgi:hypothetical protein